jgi:hypothetical protein
MIHTGSLNLKTQEMPGRTSEEEQDEKVVRTRDGSVDWYGNTSVRSKSGGWIAAVLLLGMQFFFQCH